MLSCWQRAVVRASTRKRCVSSGSLVCRNLIAARRPSRRSRARNTVPIPPSPSFLIISYWLIRTPGWGAPLTAWTAVGALSNVSHALRPDPRDGATESFRPRVGGGGAWLGWGTGTGAVPLTMVLGGAGSGCARDWGGSIGG